MRISILIPAHNEEHSIRQTLESCFSQTRPADEIVVVNDGSTDRTGEILASYGDRIKLVTLPIATGNKSFAQEIGLESVTGDVFVATDADTIMDKGFVECVERHFRDDTVCAVAGYVRSTENNWMTACREIDYTLGQDLYKQAQDHVGFLLVIPGCAGAFRTSVFREIITFDHDTITEDLDFTYKFHKNNCKIVFERNAIVYTQDPFTFHSYVNQMRRWYSGGWQNLIKHSGKVVHKPSSALELSLTYIEGVFSSFMLFFLPLLNPEFFFQTYIILYLMFTFIVASYAGWIRKRPDLLLAAPAYPFIAIVNAWIFLEQFVKELIFRNHTMAWFKPQRRVTT